MSLSGDDGIIPGMTSTYEDELWELERRILSVASPGDDGTVTAPTRVAEHPVTRLRAHRGPVSAEGRAVGRTG